MKFEGDGDDIGDASDDAAPTQKDPRKAKDARARARTIPQKQDEQDAVGYPGRTNLSPSYRRPTGTLKREPARGAGHVKRKGKNHR